MRDATCAVPPQPDAAAKLSGAGGDAACDKGGGGPRLPGSARVIAFAIGVALVARAWSPETDLMDRAAFLLVLLTAVFVVAGGLLAGKPVRGPRGVLALWTLFMIVELIQAPAGLMHPDVGGVTSGRQVLTDFGVMLLPALLVGSLSVSVAKRGLMVRVILVVVAMGIMAGFIAWFRHTPGVRFDPPPNLSIAAAWMLATLRLPEEVVTARTAVFARWAAVVVVAAFVPIILASRSRTALAVWAVSGLLAIMLPGLKRGARVKWLVAGAVLVGVATSTTQVQSVIAKEMPTLLKQARLDTLRAGQSDVSSKARLVEASDVVDTVRSEGNALVQLLGFGHGATYVPSTILIEVNVDPSTGRIHNVHMTPAMVLLRYGVLGLVVYVFLFAALIAGAIRDFFRHRDWLSAVLIVAVLTGILDALVRNAFADPTFALMVAVVALAPTFRAGTARGRT